MLVDPRPLPIIGLSSLDLDCSSRLCLPFPSQTSLVNSIYCFSVNPIAVYTFLKVSPTKMLPVIPGTAVHRGLLVLLDVLHPAAHVPFPKEVGVTRDRLGFV